MTLFEDGKEVEEIKLYGYKTEDDMHQLFEKKGLQKKSQGEIFKDQRIRMAEKELKDQERIKPVYSTITHFYMAIGLATIVFIFLINKRSASRKRKGLSLPSHS